MDIINFRKNYETFGEPFISLMGDSISNLYTPYCCMFTGQRMRRGNFEVFMYNMFNARDAQPTVDWNMEKRYTRLVNYLEMCVGAKWFTTGQEHVAAQKGTIFQVIDGRPELLMMIGIRSDYIFKIDRNNLNFSNFALFVSNSFATKDSLRLLYKWLAKNYFSECSTLGMDIIYTNSIENWMFKNCTGHPNFSTIREMKAYLSTVNQSLINEGPTPAESAIDSTRTIPTDFDPIGTINIRREELQLVTNTGR